MRHMSDGTQRPKTVIGANQGTCLPMGELTFGNTRARTHEDSHYLSRDYTVPSNNCYTYLEQVAENEPD